MAHYKGRIVEILLESHQNAAARLVCPAEAAPRPGQYLQAHYFMDPMEVLPTSIFASGRNNGGTGSDISMEIAGPIPESWQPGTELNLKGPLGHGFEIPKRARRIALIALDRNPGRLLPLVSEGLKQDAEIALFSDTSYGNLPLAVEQQKIKELVAGIKWADYLAADISIEKMDELEIVFPSRIPVALAAEILIAAPMPCGGMAKCGVCTVRTRSGSRLACEDGPVFKLQNIL